MQENIRFLIRFPHEKSRLCKNKNCNFKIHKDEADYLVKTKKLKINIKHNDIRNIKEL